MTTDKEILSKWHSVRFPSSYSNPEYFAKSLKEHGQAKNKNINEIKKVLEGDIYYQSSRLVKKKFGTRHDLESYFSLRMELDVMDIGKKLGDQLGGRYALILEDIFSKTVFIRSLSSRNSKEVLKTFKNILKALKSPFDIPGKFC